MFLTIVSDTLKSDAISCKVCVGLERYISIKPSLIVEVISIGLPLLGDTVPCIKLELFSVSEFLFIKADNQMAPKTQYFPALSVNKSSIFLVLLFSAM